MNLTLEVTILYNMYHTVYIIMLISFKVTFFALLRCSFEF